jgi:hypothetical protein
MRRVTLASQVAGIAGSSTGLAPLLDFLIFSLHVLSSFYHQPASWSTALVTCVILSSVPVLWLMFYLFLLHVSLFTGVSGTSLPSLLALLAAPARPVGSVEPLPPCLH